MHGRVALNQIQNLFYDTLVAASGSWSTSADVHDEVPDGAAYPYCEIGQTTDMVEGTKGAKWSDNTQTVFVWSTATGSKECNDIINQVVEAIMAISLPSTLADNFAADTIDRNLIQLLKVEGPNSQVFRQGIVQFMIRVEDTS